MLCLSTNLWAQDNALPVTAEFPEKKFPDFIFALPETEKAAMDIHPDRFADFWKNWRFVSSRWRQDTREFRLTYANELAWKTLIEGRTDYPVGAMFGKLVYPSEEDLALPTSVMPSNLLNRVMVMMWDPQHKKAGTDGWVYIRFINPDPRIPQDKDSTGIWGVMSKKEINSCVDCHNRAHDRANVFSQPLYLFHNKPDNVGLNDDKILENRYKETMKELPPTAIPRIANNLMESFTEWKGRKVMGYVGDFFTGALGQMRPVMAKLAQEHVDAIYMVYDRDDPNTVQIASSIKKKGYENCAGVVRLRGSTTEFQHEAARDRERRRIQDKEKIEPKKDDASSQKSTNNTQAAAKEAAQEAKALPANTKIEGQGVRIRNFIESYKPSASLDIICGADKISRQDLPLLYTVKDKDGLPSYYFAPAVAE